MRKKDTRRLRRKEWHLNVETSHSKDSAEFSELLTRGARLLYPETLLRRNSLAQPDQHFLCASPETFTVVKLSYTPEVPHVRSSTAQIRLSQNVQPLPWDASFPEA